MSYGVTIIEDNLSHSSVMAWWMMLRPVISEICISRHPEHMELALFDSVLNP